MFIGLTQGFICFGSLHHRVLLALHQLGDLRHRDLVEEIDVPPGRVATVLRQLAEHGFIHQHPAARLYETGERTQAVWSLCPYLGSKPLRRAVSQAVRSRRSREAKRKRVSSVFQMASRRTAQAVPLPG